MSATEVTAELLCVAESGDVDHLRRLLPRVADVDARNRHGMTALMKAAFFGHERVVRVLLERGADPNLIRNDRFTALALAAFFGHAETVQTLIEFGARTEAVTRAGASARTWAKARTFNEVARCLERHAPKTLTVVPAVTSPKHVAVGPTEVKTLKDPPEIWDLVQEAPRSFNPRSAFVARITSMRKTFAVGACAVQRGDRAGPQDLRRQSQRVLHHRGTQERRRLLLALLRRHPGHRDHQVLAGGQGHQPRRSEGPAPGRPGRHHQL